MSELMLQAVLRIPPEMWTGDPLDIIQRHSRYVQAADKIESMQAELATLRTELEAANECARINAENSSHWHGEAMSLQAQLAQQPASAVPEDKK